MIGTGIWVERTGAFLACALLVAAAAACSHHATLPPVSGKQQQYPGQEHGKSTFRFLTEKRKLEEGQEFQPPRPMSPLNPPRYPAAALAARAGNAVVVLRFVINSEGDITEIGLSPRGGTTEGPFADDFRYTAEAAVHSWKYSPAELQWIVPGTDINGDGKPDFRRVVRSETVPVYLDVRFEFQIVAGQPQVK